MYSSIDSRELECYRGGKIIHVSVIGSYFIKTDGKHSDKHIILFRTQSSTDLGEERKGNLECRAYMNRKTQLLMTHGLI